MIILETRNQIQASQIKSSQSRPKQTKMQFAFRGLVSCPDVGRLLLFVRVDRLAEWFNGPRGRLVLVGCTAYMALSVSLQKTCRHQPSDLLQLALSRICQPQSMLRLDLKSRGPFEPSCLCSCPGHRVSAQGRAAKDGGMMKFQLGDTGHAKRRGAERRDLKRRMAGPG